jgi:hypothetical protein
MCGSNKREAPDHRDAPRLGQSPEQPRNLPKGETHGRA